MAAFCPGVVGRQACRVRANDPGDVDAGCCSGGNRPERAAGGPAATIDQPRHRVGRTGGLRPRTELSERRDLPRAEPTVVSQAKDVDLERGVRLDLEGHRLTAVHADIRREPLNARIACAADLPFALGVSWLAVLDLDRIAQTRSGGRALNERDVRIVRVTEHCQDERRKRRGGVLTEAQHLVQPLGESFRRIVAQPVTPASAERQYQTLIVGKLNVTRQPRTSSGRGAAAMIQQRPRHPVRSGRVSLPHQNHSRISTRRIDRARYDSRKSSNKKTSFMRNGSGPGRLERTPRSAVYAVIDVREMLEAPGIDAVDRPETRTKAQRNARKVSLTYSPGLPRVRRRFLMRAVMIQGSFWSAAS